MEHNLKLTALCLTLLLGPLQLQTSADQNCKTSIIASKPTSSFTINNDGTVTDNKMGLVWMRCSLGQKWDQNTCSGTAVAASWAESLKAAASEEFAGYTDWRLPNKNELESIVEDSCSSPAINATIFPATPPTYFWSSSPYAAIAQAAWSVDFGYGTVNASVKSGAIYIRLVRDRE